MRATIPDAYQTVTPFPLVKGAPRLIKFLKAAFDATELMRFHEPDGSVVHAEVKIGDSIMMIGEAMEGVPPMPASLHLYVVDADATYRAALTAGGESLKQPINRFWGDRTAGIKDPAGNKWWITTQVEVAPDEIARGTQASPSVGSTG
ncbi:MAG: VOC family protein [Gammaproteobacteria bacterium]